MSYFRFGYLGVLLSLVLFLFSSCRIWPTQVLTKEEFFQMVDGSFDRVSDVLKLFPKSAEDAEKRVVYVVDSVSDSIKKMLAVDDSKRTFENTVKILDDASRVFGVAASALLVTSKTNPDKSLCEAAHKALARLDEFSVDAFMNPDIYRAFKSYFDGAFKRESLSDEKKYYVNESMKDFERNGFHLPEETFEKVKQLKKDLGALGLEFSRNLSTDNSFITVEKDGLDGLPKNIVDSLELENGRYILRCNMPTYDAVRKHARNRSTRFEMNRAWKNRGYPVNEPILEKIVARRDRLSKLVGHPSYSDLNISSQMAKKADNVDVFLRALCGRLRDKERKEVALFSSNLPDGVEFRDGKFDACDFHYVKEQYKKNHLSLDENVIQEYFPLEKTLDGMLSIYQDFLGLDFKMVNLNGQAWHDDVKLVEIRRRGETSLFGYLFLDLYPRENKYGHACFCGIYPSLVPEAGCKKRPFVGIVIANFSKSTGKVPSLLTHDEVTTFFHEFGHAMHGLLGETELSGCSGTHTKTDFVEVPSQMFEQWMWDKDMLKRVSSHYKMGDPLPDDVIDRMVAAKRFDKGGWVHRQCALSLLALSYFGEGEKKNLYDIWMKIWADELPYLREDPETHFYAGFGHLGGYGAKYYSYMWSLAIAIDFFENLKKRDGLLDASAGRDFIKKVIGRGGSNDPDLFVRDFLGRESSLEAFLKDYIGV